MSDRHLAPGAAGRGKYRVERVLGGGGMGVVSRRTHLALERARRDQVPAARTLLGDPERGGALPARGARGRRASRASTSRASSTSGTLDDGRPVHGDGATSRARISARCSSSAGRARPMARGRRATCCRPARRSPRRTRSASCTATSSPRTCSSRRRADGTPLVKVLDFGISKVDGGSDGDRRPRTEPASWASPTYMSPEQMRSARDVDARRGHLVARHRPARALTGDASVHGDLDCRRALRRGRDPPGSRALARVRRPDVPVELDAVVFRCLRNSRMRGRRASSSSPGCCRRSRAPRPRAPPTALRASGRQSPSRARRTSRL